MMTRGFQQVPSIQGFEVFATGVHWNHMRIADVCMVRFTEMMTNHMNLRMRLPSEMRSKVKAKLVLLQAADKVEKLPERFKVRRRSAKVEFGIS